MTKYFTLATSNASLSKRFRVVADGFVDNLQKKQDVQTTIDGNLDVSVGSIFRTWNFVVRVRYEEEVDDYGGADYGTYDELKQFFSYNNPTGTPSNVLTLTDHYGDTYSVVFADNFQGKPFATVLIGQDAWYWVNVTFLCITAETEPTS
jgi:hypothetical protein